MNSVKLIIVDLFFIISSIIGIGFATGKEISLYFTSGKSIILAVLIFFVCFTGLTKYFLYVKNKYKLSNVGDLNKVAFGNNYEIFNIVLVIFFIITNSAMLAGCDSILKTYFNFNIPIGSLFLSCVTFFVVVGGVNRIKNTSKYIAPIIIILLMIIGFKNFKIGNLDGGVMVDVLYPIFFCAHNFVLLLAVIFNTKSNPKLLSFLSGILVSFIVLVCAVAVKNINADMPMLLLGKNLGNLFFVIYLIGVVFALFTTLQVGSYQCFEIISKNKNQNFFSLSLILLTCQIIAYLGFSFIIQYLYAGMGILGVIYLIILIINLIIKRK